MTETARPGARRRRKPSASSGQEATAETTPAESSAVHEAPLAAPARAYVPTGFAALGVPAEIDAGLFAAGFDQPFAIQTEAIPVALTGQDVCGRARTGSGKTLAFGVPLLARITPGANTRRPKGLVLVPTRELAIQVADVLAPVAAASGRTVLAAYGGSSRAQQIVELKRGIDVVVATPLRLIDLLKGNELELSEIEVVVIDEADRMADDGFTPQVEWILRQVTGPHQTMLFSATLDGQVGHLVRKYQNDPVTVAIDSATETVGTMHHVFLAVHHMDKDRVVAAIAGSVTRTVLFCHTKRACDRVTRSLEELGVNVAAIHGDLPQPMREKALRRFTVGELSVLVATDVAARGIDVEGIDVVIHYEPAADSKSYLHRSGRTARAGRDGYAVTLAEYNQHLACRIIQRQLRLEMREPTEVFSNDKRLKDLSSFAPESAPITA